MCTQKREPNALLGRVLKEGFMEVMICVLGLRISSGIEICP